MISKNSYLDADQACVTFNTFDGKGIKINKYFLLLYNTFYRNILSEFIEEGQVFIFESATLDDLSILKEQIYQKHLQCKDCFQSSKENQNNEASSDSILRTEFVDDEKLMDKDKLDTPDNRETDEPLIMECPFKCNEVPDSDWTVDTLFAHIFTKHIKDVKNNFFVSIDTFIGKLGSSLSSFKCVLKCEKSRNVFTDLRALKSHYYRCHVEDPVICPNCGASFNNAMAYYTHHHRTHSGKKNCSLCGKTFRNVYGHMLHAHGEKKITCKVEGCSVRFAVINELLKHTRVVHEKEKSFVCDLCGIKMAQVSNLKAHRMKVHKAGNLSFKEYKDMIRSGQHKFLPKDSEIPPCI